MEEKRECESSYKAIDMCEHNDSCRLLHIYQNEIDTHNEATQFCPSKQNVTVHSTKKKKLLPGILTNKKRYTSSYECMCIHRLLDSAKINNINLKL